MNKPLYIFTPEGEAFVFATSQVIPLVFNFCVNDSTLPFSGMPMNFMCVCPCTIMQNKDSIKVTIFIVVRFLIILMLIHKLDNGLQRNVANGNTCAHFHERNLPVIFHQNNHGNTLLGSF